MQHSSNLSTLLVPFYLDEQPDIEGRMIHEIWAWNDFELAINHDFIQWLFPLLEASEFNLDAPRLNQQIIQEFHRHTRLKQHLRRSLKVMLKFYGLQHTDDASDYVRIQPSERYALRKFDWISPNNHNYLRITRILKSLMLLGLSDDAQAFYRCLQQIYTEEQHQIGKHTWQYWTEAVLVNEAGGGRGK